jgi:hypothetical protein
MLFLPNRLELLWCLNGDWEAVFKERVVKLIGDLAVAVEFPKLSMMAKQTTATFCPDNPLNPEIYVNNI